MNKSIAWFSENRMVVSLAASLIGAAALLGWLAGQAWDDYGAASAEYTSKASQLSNLSQQKPFPNKVNLAKLEKSVALQKTELASLVKALQSFNATPFDNLGKANPQDRPQQFQDALRDEVTAIKKLASDSGAILPPGFYLGMEEYENKPPGAEETLALAKQLTILSWIAENLVKQKGIIIAEFSRMPAETGAIGTKKEVLKKTALTAPASKTPPPYQTTVLTRISCRCNQTPLREIINSMVSAPFFLMIESLQLQNSSSEPPHRAAASQPAQQNPDGMDAVQRLPIIVGREQLNISLKVRALEFTDPQQASETPAK